MYHTHLYLVQYIYFMNSANTAAVPPIPHVQTRHTDTSSSLKRSSQQQYCTPTRLLSERLSRKHEGNKFLNLFANSSLLSSSLFSLHTSTNQLTYRMAQVLRESKDVKCWTLSGATRKVVLILITIALVLTSALTVTNVWFGISESNRRTIISRLAASQGSSDRTICSSGSPALVNNKSPKTASSFIQAVIINWTLEMNRHFYDCHKTPLLSTANLRHCLPRVADPCGVFSSHVFLNQDAIKTFSERLPNHLLLTSTRYPAHRIVSMFLFVSKMRGNNPNIEHGLTWFIKRLNPWDLYNFHTGEYMNGSCPLTDLEVRRVWSAVSKFDVVIDTNAIRASNVILKHHQLFTLPHITDLQVRLKERGTVHANISAKVRELLRPKLCVEYQLHRAFQIKMARLYEAASGKVCFFNSRLPTLDTCIQREEAETLKDTWKLDYHK